MKFIPENILKPIKIKKILFSFFVLLAFIPFVISGKINFLKANGPENCLACHDDKELTMDAGGKKISLYVDGAKFSKSMHGSMDCKDCHAGYNSDALPHNPKKKKVDCKECHGNLKMESGNVHNNVECNKCHTSHYIISAKEFSRNQTNLCLDCHKSKSVQIYKSSKHASRDVKCETCHQGGHNVRKYSKFESTSLCGKCHNSSLKNFNNSIHEISLKSGNKNVPICIDCHGAHEIVSSKMSIESKGCLKCHLNEKLFPGENKGSAKFVSNYKTSIHASIIKNGNESAGCIDCHGNHMIQHAENPEASVTRMRLPETCGKCHQDLVEKFNKSAHGKALKEKNVAAPTCISCHSEHSIKAVRNDNEFSKLRQVDMCLNCHIEGKLPHKNYKGEEVLISNYKDSFHYRALLEGKTNVATCTDCHGSHEMNHYDDPNSKIYKKNIAKTCGRCHSKQYNEFTGSIHDVSLMTKEKSDAPTCTNCHGNHQILRKSDETNRIANPKGLVQLCYDCHNSVELVKKYDLPFGKTESYSSSFHGLAIRGGSKVAANCGSCHGNHNIRPSEDSLSTINKNNLPTTCGKCHPGAMQTLFTTSIHSSENDKKNSPALFWIKTFYILLIVVTIGGMTLHNIVDFWKKKKIKKIKNSKSK